jgi:hypothetical protein
LFEISALSARVWPGRTILSHSEAGVPVQLGVSPLLSDENREQRAPASTPTASFIRQRTGAWNSGADSSGGDEDGQKQSRALAVDDPEPILARRKVRGADLQAVQVVRLVTAGEGIFRVVDRSSGSGE